MASGNDSSVDKPWYLAPQFDHFWRHYKSMHQWMAEHNRTVERLQELDRTTTTATTKTTPATTTATTGQGFPPPPPLPPIPDELVALAASINDDAEFAHPSPSAPADVEMAVEIGPAGDDDLEDQPSSSIASQTECDHYEMSSEMVEFFRKTMEHRLERDKQKLADDEIGSSTQQSWLVNTDPNEFIAADKVGVEGYVSSSLLTPDRRTLEQEKRMAAERLYGANFERIMAMETVMQMRFDQEYDKKKPPFWPNIPFRI